MDRLSEEYNLARKNLISVDASMEVRPGKIDGFNGRVVVRPKGKTQNHFLNLILESQSS